MQTVCNQRGIAFLNFIDLATRTFQRKEHDLENPVTKTWILAAFQQYLLQGCEALAPTSRNAPLEIEAREKELKSLLDNRFILRSLIKRLRHLMRSSFPMIEEDSMLKLILSLYHEGAYKRLQVITQNKYKTPIHLEDGILKKKWDVYKKCPLEQRNPILLGEMLKEIQKIRATMYQSKYKNDLAQFLQFENDRCAALKKIITNLAKLINLCEPKIPKFHDSIIVKLFRKFGNVNAHEREEFICVGGVYEPISKEKIFELFNETNYLAAFENLILSHMKETFSIDQTVRQEH